jgi:hypothetical protein
MKRAMYVDAMHTPSGVLAEVFWKLGYWKVVNSRNPQVLGWRRMKSFQLKFNPGRLPQ